MYILKMIFILQMVLLMHEEHNLFVKDLVAGLFISYKKHSWMFCNITFCWETNMI